MIGSLQIGRFVENNAMIAEIAQALGFEPLPNYHVTIAYSRKAVNWNKPVFHPLDNFMLVGIHDMPILRLGPNEDLIALGLYAKALSERHKSLQDAGTSWDFEAYKPHITLGALNPATELPGTVTLPETLVLGPEYRETANHI